MKPKKNFKLKKTINASCLYGKSTAIKTTTMLYFLLLLLLKVFSGNQILLIQQNCEYTFQSLTFLQVSARTARTRRNLDQEAWTRKLSNLHYLLSKNCIFEEFIVVFRSVFRCLNF